MIKLNNFTINNRFETLYMLIFGSAFQTHTDLLNHMNWLYFASNNKQQDLIYKGVAKQFGKVVFF